MGLKLTRNQVAERYGGRHPSTIDRWMQDKRLDFPKPLYIGRSPLWDTDDLERWERERITQSSPSIE
jgi:predicted DNA-binding transcriptional regulator AlpA